MIVTSQKYGQFLVNSHVNFTGMYFADTVDDLDHNSVYRFLKSNKLSPAQLREKADDIVITSSDGYVIFDDTVIDKNFSRDIALVRKQYSGNAHRIIRGIGVVTCIYYNPTTDFSYVLDYRIWAPDEDGKTKLDHVTEMFNELLRKETAFQNVLMDTWYATTKLMKHIDQSNKTYYCPLKSNRMVDDSGGATPYQRVNGLMWNDQELLSGKIVKVRGFPKDQKHKLFRVVVSTDRTDMVITNDLSQSSTDDVRKVHAIRWRIEEFHRELKGVTGIQNCQARLGRSQRNHICVAFQAWLVLKQAAIAKGVTIYQQKREPLLRFVAEQWRNPATAFS